MTCPRCGGNNVVFQIVNESELKNAHHGFFWWMFVGWWWVMFKWLFLTIPALLAKIFIPRKQKIKNVQRTLCVCQSCGYKWDAPDRPAVQSAPVSPSAPDPVPDSQPAPVSQPKAEPVSCAIPERPFRPRSRFESYGPSASSEAPATVTVDLDGMTFSAIPLLYSEAEKRHWTVSLIRDISCIIMIACVVFGIFWSYTYWTPFIMSRSGLDSMPASIIAIFLGVLLSLLGSLIVTLPLWIVSTVVDDLRALRLYASGYIIKKLKR